MNVCMYVCVHFLCVEIENLQESSEEEEQFQEPVDEYANSIYGDGEDL